MRFKTFSFYLILLACIVALLYAGQNQYYSSDSRSTALTLTPSLVVPVAPVVVQEGYPGEMVAGTIPLENRGPKAITINKVVPNCGCTFVDNKEGFTIEAGRTENLGIKIRLPAQQSFGSKTYNVRIFCDDPYSETADVGIVIKTKPPWVVAEPNEIDFHEVVAGKSYAQVVLVNAVADQPIDYATENGLIGVSKVSVDEKDGQSSAFKITLNEKLPLGFFTDNLILSNAKGQKAFINVRGIVRERRQVDPKQLDLKPGVRDKKVFVVRYLDTGPTEITLSAPPFLNCEVRKLSSTNQDFALIVTYGGARSPPEECAISVNAIPSSDSFNIPVFWKGASK